MTITLKPGALGDPAATTKPPEFKDSIAEAIENALHDLLPPERQFDKDVNTAEARDRRILFVAIAQGICKYLSTHSTVVVKHSTGNDLTATHTVTIGSTP